MFSIFGKRKPAETPTEDQPIQGPAEGPRPGTSGDDFVFIERKPGPDAPPPSALPFASPGPMYPPMPPAGYLPYPPMPGARGSPAKLPGAQVPGPVNYLQDIPFELAPELATKDRYASTQMQVDSILALLTRQMSVDELAEEYTFALERSVQNECY
ncbi:zinc finger and BTB domain-containing protein 45 [Drosophila takahashii]|uniref:zinc finger and BTB domain-containing protein 45 n=1 Tax=Drosophila takahashii TaxID=29030 RepID=UPI001CF844E5|nr:formin-2 [Drosophila takahashii]